MRLAFVTPRFRAGDATPPELLAAALADRAPGGWRTTVFTTTAAADSEEAFRDGEVQEKGVRVVRFPGEAPPPPASGGRAAPDALTSAGLVEHLRDRVGDYDLVVLFGSSSLCLEAAKIHPGRTVLLPFADEAMAASGESEIFRHPAAFVFGSEAEEILVLKRFQVHRRMRETIAGALLLPRRAATSGRREGTGLEGNYLIAAGPLEPGRGVEELLRFFSTFRDRHPDSVLGLVLLGPAALRIPKRPDIRVVSPGDTRERLDVLGGALVAVIPERLATFSTTAAEPFSLGVPILVNASATELAEDCRASGGGLYYQNYDEFELILELGIRDRSLFARLGAAGRRFLESRHDWDQMLARYDRAFRSFTRPSRAGAADAGLAESTTVPDKPDTAGADQPAEAQAAGVQAAEVVPPSPDSESAESGQPPAEDHESEPARAAAESEGIAPSPVETLEGSALLEEATGVSEMEAASEPDEPSVSDTDLDSQDSPAAEGADEEDVSGTGDGSLPSFFRSSLRG